MLALVFSFSHASQADIIPITINSNASDSVEGDSGWLDEDTFFGGLDFLTFTLEEEAIISVYIDALSSFGISLYSGEIMNEAGIVFNNNSDFFDFSNTLTFIQGNAPFVPADGDNRLTDVILASGDYTIAVGGNEGLFSFDSVAYNLSLDAVTVSAPQATLLLLIGFMTMTLVRRQQR